MSSSTFGEEDRFDDEQHSTSKSFRKGTGRAQKGPRRDPVDNQRGRAQKGPPRRPMDTVGEDLFEDEQRPAGKKGTRRARKGMHRTQDVPRQEPLAVMRTASQTFSQIDKNHDGAIDYGELREALGHGLLEGSGLVSKNKQAKAWMDQFDADNSGTLDLDEFRRLVADIDAAIERKKEEIATTERKLAAAFEKRGL
jgi:hypothetical protein